MYRICLVCGIIFFANIINIFAQEPPAEPPLKPKTTQTADTESQSRDQKPPYTDSPLQDLFTRFRGRAVVLEINARIIERDEQVSWNESQRKTTIPGRPVGLKLVGANVVVAAQFTPYLRRGAQKSIVAQCQIWIDIPNQGISYHTSMQTIPVEFGETIYFLPLGPSKGDNSEFIEIMVTLLPYDEN